MTDPVDTDALRAAARKAGAAIAAVALNGGRIQMRVPADPESDTDLLVCALECDALAAADEVDRLRAELDAWEPAWRNMRDERDRMRAAIENAPHAFECPSRVARLHPRPCTCWKAETR